MYKFTIKGLHALSFNKMQEIVVQYHFRDCEVRKLDNSNSQSIYDTLPIQLIFLPLMFACLRFFTVKTARNSESQVIALSKQGNQSEANWNFGRS